ncbi:MAG TPA: hypothetical protein VFR94_19165 [Nitrososphaeraceae archaeon]|nr:hypothetical protein [Nitrososphaeraceae archaeon]
MTEKMIPPKTKAEVQSRRCCSCDKPDSETALLTIVLPPVIMERQDLCPCLAVAIDDSKKKGKVTI